MELFCLVSEYVLKKVVVVELSHFGHWASVPHRSSHSHIFITFWLCLHKDMHIAVAVYCELYSLNSHITLVVMFNAYVSSNKKSGTFLENKRSSYKENDIIFATQE
jgi:hypothetical protein